MHRIPLVAAMAATFGLLTAGTASAQRFDPRENARFPRRGGFGFESIHRTARSIEKNAHDLHEELDVHFRRSPAYRHLHAHAQEIERLGRVIHDITDSRGGRRLLRQTVNRLDDEVHHFVEVVEDSRQFRGVSPRAYAHLRREVSQLHRAVVALKRQLD